MSNLMHAVLINPSYQYLVNLGETNQFGQPKLTSVASTKEGFNIWKQSHPNFALEKIAKKANFAITAEELAKCDGALEYLASNSKNGAHQDGLYIISVFDDLNKYKLVENADENSLANDYLITFKEITTQKGNKMKTFQVIDSLKNNYFQQLNKSSQEEIVRQEVASFQKTFSVAQTAMPTVTRPNLKMLGSYKQQAPTVDTTAKQEETVDTKAEVITPKVETKKHLWRNLDNPSQTKSQISKPSKGNWEMIE